MFCVFEGIDGSGKSTLVRAVYERLTNRPSNHRLPASIKGVRLLREPTEMETGQRIKELLMGKAELGREEWLELFLEDRARNVAQNILPWRGSHLLLQDRYFYSTAVYQGQENAPPTPADIVELNRAKDFPEPDLLFYLDLPVDTALERIQKGRSSVEVFETREFLELIRSRYKNILPSSSIVIDAERPPSELEEEVVQAITQAAAKQ